MCSNVLKIDHIALTKVLYVYFSFSIRDFNFFKSSIHRIDGLEHRSKLYSKIFTTKFKSASLQNEKSADLSCNKESENLIDNLLNRVIR